MHLGFVKSPYNGCKKSIVNKAYYKLSDWY